MRSSSIFTGSVFFRKSESLTQPRDMRVHNDPDIRVERIPQDHIRRFPPDAGQFH